MLKCKGIMRGNRFKPRMRFVMFSGGREKDLLRLYTNRSRMSQEVNDEEI